MCRTAINVKDFGSHSVRSAVTPKASSSAVLIAAILAKAGWSKESKFGKFYDKPALDMYDKKEFCIVDSVFVTFSFEVSGKIVRNSLNKNEFKN